MAPLPGIRNIVVTGDNFLRPEEGNSWARVTGTFTHEDTELGTKEFNGERVAIRWAGSRTTGEFHIDPGVFGVLPPLRCSVFWLSAVQDSFEIGTTIPAHTGGFGSVGVAPRSLNRGSLALRGTRATLTGAGLSHFDDRLPVVWEAMLEGNVLRIEGTGLWDFPGENQLVPARWVVRSRRCPAEWLHGSHGARGSWCNPLNP